MTQDAVAIRWPGCLCTRCVLLWPKELGSSSSADALGLSVVDDVSGEQLGGFVEDVIDPSNLKTWLRGTYHGVSNKHLDSSLQEFVYRFNRRGFEHELFEYVIGAAAIASPLAYDQLTAERTG